MTLDREFLLKHLREYAAMCRFRHGFLKFKWWSADIDSIAEEHDQDVIDLSYSVWLEWSREQSEHDEDDLWEYMWKDDLEALLRKDPDYFPE